MMPETAITPQMPATTAPYTRRPRIERRLRGLPPRSFLAGPALRAFGISPPARSSRDRRRFSADASRASNTGSRRPRPSAIEKSPRALAQEPVRPAFHEGADGHAKRGGLRGG